MEEKKKTIRVVAAIITDGKRILATQRGYGAFKGMWEFPGGKMEAGELPEAALAREIREELAVEIGIDQLLCTVNYDYPQFHLTMHCFMCHIVAGVPQLLEHKSARWLSASDLDAVEWLPADIEVVKLLRNSLQNDIH